MKINYTSKLFFKKFPYKVVLENRLSVGRRYRSDMYQPQEFETVTAWCEKHVSGQHKIQRRFQGSAKKGYDWHQLIYLQSEAGKNALVKDFGAQVVEVWQPLDVNHLQQLEVRNLTEVRAQLIYKKYHHVIYFKYDRTMEMWTWLTDLLKDNPNSDLRGSVWWPKVYSSDLDDIRMIQLSYPEKIDYIKHVILIPS